MNVVELSDEENRVIFAGRFLDSLADLDQGTQQKEVLKKIRQLLDSDAPDRFIYEDASDVEELQVIRPNNLLRVYCTLVMGIPDHAKTYNLLYVFYIDKHKYRTRDLQKWDQEAQRQLDHILSLQSVGELEQYFESANALDADDLTEMIDRGSEAFD